MESGLPGFPQGFSCPVVLKKVTESLFPFTYWTVTVSGGPFQGPLVRGQVFHSLEVRQHLLVTPYNPPWV